MPQPTKPDDMAVFARVLGGRLRQVRAERGLSCAAVAESIHGLDGRRLAQIEQGLIGVSVTRLREICGVLHLDFATFLAAVEHDLATRCPIVWIPVHALKRIHDPALARLCSEHISGAIIRLDCDLLLYAAVRSGRAPTDLIHHLLELAPSVLATTHHWPETTATPSNSEHL